MVLAVNVEGQRETLAAFRALPKEATAELRKAALDISRGLAAQVAAAGRARGGQAALVATTVKAKFDRVPAMTVGGPARVGRHGTPAVNLLIGSEFGHGGHGGRGRGSRDYAPHGMPRRRSPEGIWIFPTIKAGAADSAERWHEAATAIVEAFSRTPPSPRS